MPRSHGRRCYASRCERRNIVHIESRFDRSDPAGGSRAKGGAVGKRRRPRPENRETLIPTFDPAELAKKLEGGRRDSERPTPRARATEPPPVSGEGEIDYSRAMYGRYLASDFAGALELAERIREKEPEHALASLVAERCRAVMEEERAANAHDSDEPQPLLTSSILRVSKSLNDLKSLQLDPASAFVLLHVDGVSDAETIADLTGIPRDKAISHLQALLDVGAVKIVG
jgi:hypothetical protein